MGAGLSLFVRSELVVVAAAEELLELLRDAGFVKSSISIDADRLLAPPEALGVLDRVVNRVAAIAGPDVASGTLVLAGADHPVTRHGVSAYASSVTADVMRAARAGCWT